MNAQSVTRDRYRSTTQCPTRHCWISSILCILNPLWCSFLLRSLFKLLSGKNEMTITTLRSDILQNIVWPVLILYSLRSLRRLSLCIFYVNWIDITDTVDDDAFYAIRLPKKDRWKRAGSKKRRGRYHLETRHLTRLCSLSFIPYIKNFPSFIFPRLKEPTKLVCSTTNENLCNMFIDTPLVNHTVPFLLGGGGTNPWLCLNFYLDTYLVHSILFQFILFWFNSL